MLTLIGIILLSLFGAYQPDEEENPNAGLDFNVLLKEYQQEIKVITYDTARIGAYYIYLKKYYKKDASYIAPPEYNWGATNVSRPVHEYLAEVKVMKDTTLILLDTICKEKILPFIEDDSLKKYGEISGLYIEKVSVDSAALFSKEPFITFSFSFSIPLTDIGKGLYYELYLNKKFRIPPY